MIKPTLTEEMNKFDPFARYARQLEEKMEEDADADDDNAFDPSDEYSPVKIGGLPGGIFGVQASDKEADVDGILSSVSVCLLSLNTNTKRIMEECYCFNSQSRFLISYRPSRKRGPRPAEEEEEQKDQRRWISASRTRR